MRRLRPALFVLALTLTSLALGPKARAAECTDGNRGWIDFGTCCWQLDNEVQLLPGICVDGNWQIDSSRAGYKCLIGTTC